MDRGIFKVEEITGKDSSISSIYGGLQEDDGLEKAKQHASSRRNPCRIYRLVGNNVWHGIEEKERAG